MSSSDLVGLGGPVVRDQGIGRQVSDESYSSSHRTDNTFIGLRLPSRPHRPGKHHHKHRGKTSASYTVNHVDSVAPTAVENFLASMSPSEKIQHLIGENDEETHNIFCQLDTLQRIGIEYQWREAARWVKYEEDVEEGGSRWSKPHVASLSLHSLFELRSSLLQGAVMLSMDAYHIGQIADMILDSWINNKQLEERLRDPIRTAIVSFHWNQHQKRRRSVMPDDDPKGGFKRRSVKRTFSEIGRSFSVKGRENSSGHLSHRSAANLRGNPNSIPNMENMGDLPDSASSTKLNVDFMRKIPDGAEAANIMVGEMDCLKYQITAFVRLTEGRHVGDMTEVPIPTRFIFILLGPTGSYSKNFEMGRSISTILVDEVFREVAYKARNRTDLLSGIDEFLDQVTVLPPGEWDPKIRIEPPDSVPSQEGRKIAKVPTAVSVPTENGAPVAPKPAPQEEEEEESHCDPTLARTGRLFGGLINDVKRKLPYYWSDYTDCVHIQCIASVVYLFLATLTPNVTFGGLLGQATDQYMGTMECILTASLCGILFALFAGQPLNILGSTGPMLVLEMILFNVCKDQGLVYMPFRCWVGIWTAGLCLIIVAFDLSSLVRYITRFTEESFACLIAIIFIYEAFKKEIGIIKKYPLNPTHYSDVCDCLNPYLNDTFLNGTDYNDTYSGYSMYSIMGDNSTTNMTMDWGSFNKTTCAMYNGTLVGEGCVEHDEFKPNVFFFSILLFFGTYIIASTLTGMKNGQFFPSSVRQLLSDFAVLLSIIIMVAIDIVIGVPTPKLEVPSEFTTSRPGRGWLVSPIHPDNPWWLALAAAVPAVLAVILVFMDQQITAVIVNRKENKLKKGSGYHLDMMVVAICILACSFLGLPWYVAATVSALAHVMSLKKESECTAPGEKPTFLGVREQRVTALMVGILSGLAVFLTKVLGVIPMPVLYGVFLYMGVAALRGMQLVDRIAIIFMPSKYQPDRLYLRHVRIKRVHLFTLIQVCCLSVLWVIKQVKSISIVFPIMVAGTCFVRLAMGRIFSPQELKWLDDIMPEDKARAKEDKNKNSETEGLLEEEYEKPKGNFDERVNISEEMSKTSIWLQVRRDSCRHDNEDLAMRMNKRKKERKNSEISGKEEKAAFYFGDDDDNKLKELPE